MRARTVHLARASTFISIIVASVCVADPAGEVKPFTQSQYRVRHAAQLPACAIALYDIERSSLPDESKRALTELFRSLEKDLTALIQKGDQQPEKADDVISEIKARLTASRPEMEKILDKPRATALAEVSSVIRYEAALLSRIRFLPQKGPEKIEGHLDDIGATAEQRARVTAIRDQWAAESERLREKEWKESSKLTEMTSQLWSFEHDAAARKWVRAVRALLTPDQLVRWEASVRAGMPKRDRSSSPKP